jgi:uncharacterized protein (TIGR02118 family)
VIKLVFCLHRLAPLSREEFQAYWHDRHAPLVARHATTLRIERYVQVHTLDAPATLALRASRGGPAEYDGVAELWWRSTEDLATATSTEEGRQASAELLEDERRFIDLQRSPLWIAHDRLIVAA